MVFAVDAFKEFQRLVLSADDLLVNFAFSCNVCHYTKAGGVTAAPEYIKYTPSNQNEHYNSGGAVQHRPGFLQPTPRLLSGTFRDFQRLKLKRL